jgi:hypothetical protein
LADTHAIVTARDVAVAGTPPTTGSYIHLNIAQGPKLLGTPRKTRLANSVQFSQGAEYIITFSAYRAEAPDFIAKIMLLQDTAPPPFDIEFLMPATEISGMDQTTYETRWSSQARVYVRLEDTVATTVSPVTSITVDVTTNP